MPTPSTPIKKILFNTRDELLCVNVDSIYCFVADGNYSSLVLLNGNKYTITMNLKSLGDLLSKQLGKSATTFARIGKGVIINLHYVQHLSVLRQRIVLGDGIRPSVNVAASKSAIKSLKDVLLRHQSLFFSKEAPSISSK